MNKNASIKYESMNFILFELTEGIYAAIELEKNTGSNAGIINLGKVPDTALNIGLFYMEKRDLHLVPFEPGHSQGDLLAKDLLGDTLQGMLEAELEEDLGYLSTITKAKRRITAETATGFPC